MLKERLLMLLEHFLVEKLHCCSLYRGSFKMASTGRGPIGYHCKALASDEHNCNTNLDFWGSPQMPGILGLSEITWSSAKTLNRSLKTTVRSWIRPNRQILGRYCPIGVGLGQSFSVEASPPHHRQSCPNLGTRWMLIGSKWSGLHVFCLITWLRVARYFLARTFSAGVWLMADFFNMSAQISAPNLQTKGVDCCCDLWIFHA